ncbi:MAG: glycerol-3-phosphate 1-O-acyltransferase PlsY [Cohaesibacteraceae bacterium]|nr:glycerol-3-phosphate 1-O-acyltransferase PlsY [Cohaesibacteraceae bacterium]
MPDPISWTLAGPYYAYAILFGYILGSTPFGLMFTKMAGLGDVREIGSGNIGATNVLRTGNKKIAALTLLGDLLKGTLAVLIAANQYGDEIALLAGLGAFFGHLFPFWLKFKGGKGVATYIGVLLGIYWPAMICFALVWMLFAFVSRFSSLAALIAAIVTPIVLVAMGQNQIAEMYTLLTLILWLKHLPNIKRLIKGTESRIGGLG